MVAGRLLSLVSQAGIVGAGKPAWYGAA